MELTTFLTTVFCVIDDWLGNRRLRQRGPRPVPADSEVLTIECVGEFLGIDTDAGLYSYFRRHWARGSLACAGCTAPPSPARPPTCGWSSTTSSSTCSPRSAMTRRSR
jgi:hypothetical protein